MAAKVFVESVAGAKFAQRIVTGEHILFGDEPLDVGGDDKGLTPYQFLLSALGT